MHYEWSFVRLARCAGRPALAAERLSLLRDGRLLYRLKRRWRNGARYVILEPLGPAAKPAALLILVPDGTFCVVADTNSGEVRRIYLRASAAWATISSVIGKWQTGLR